MKKGQSIATTRAYSLKKMLLTGVTFCVSFFLLFPFKTANTYNTTKMLLLLKAFIHLMQIAIPSEVVMNKK